MTPETLYLKIQLVFMTKLKTIDLAVVIHLACLAESRISSPESLTSDTHLILKTKNPSTRFGAKGNRVETKSEKRHGLITLSYYSSCSSSS